MTLALEDELSYAFQLEELEDGLVKVTTFIPYKISKNNILVNSFEYANKIKIDKKAEDITIKKTETVDRTFVDVTVTVISYYYQEYSWENAMTFYRHAGIEAYWSTSNSSVSVNNMLINYESCGDLYKYPDCINEQDPVCLEEDYYIKSSINKWYPTEYTVYIDGNNTMPYNRVINCCDYWEHGGLIYIKIDYYVNGNHRVDDTSYYIYGA